MECPGRRPLENILLHSITPTLLDPQLVPYSMCPSSRLQVDQGSAFNVRRSWSWRSGQLKSQQTPVLAPAAVNRQVDAGIPPSEASNHHWRCTGPGFADLFGTTRCNYRRLGHAWGCWWLGKLPPARIQANGRYSCCPRLVLADTSLNSW